MTQILGKRILTHSLNYRKMRTNWKKTMMKNFFGHLGLFQQQEHYFVQVVVAEEAGVDFELVFVLELGQEQGLLHLQNSMLKTKKTYLPSFFFFSLASCFSFLNPCSSSFELPRFSKTTTLNYSHCHWSSLVYHVSVSYQELH